MDPFAIECMKIFFQFTTAVVWIALGLIFLVLVLVGLARILKWIAPFRNEALHRSRIEVCEAAWDWSGNRNDEIKIRALKVATDRWREVEHPPDYGY